MSFIFFKNKKKRHFFHLFFIITPFLMHCQRNSQEVGAHDAGCLKFSEAAAPEYLLPYFNWVVSEDKNAGTSIWRKKNNATALKEKICSLKSAYIFNGLSDPYFISDSKKSGNDSDEAFNRAISKASTDLKKSFDDYFEQTVGTNEDHCKSSNQEYILALVTDLYGRGDSSIQVTFYNYDSDTKKKNMKEASFIFKNGQLSENLNKEAFELNFPESISQIVDSIVKLSFDPNESKLQAHEQQQYDQMLVLNKAHGAMIDLSQSEIINNWLSNFSDSSNTEKKSIEFPVNYSQTSQDLKNTTNKHVLFIDSQGEDGSNPSQIISPLWSFEKITTQLSSLLKSDPDRKSEICDIAKETGLFDLDSVASGKTLKSQCQYSSPLENIYLESSSPHLASLTAQPCGASAADKKEMGSSSSPAGLSYDAEREGDGFSRIPSESVSQCQSGSQNDFQLLGQNHTASVGLCNMTSGSSKKRLFYLNDLGEALAPLKSILAQNSSSPQNPDFLIQLGQAGTYESNWSEDKPDIHKISFPSGKSKDVPDFASFDSCYAGENPSGIFSEQKVIATLSSPNPLFTYLFKYETLTPLSARMMPFLIADIHYYMIQHNQTKPLTSLQNPFPGAQFLNHLRKGLEVDQVLKNFDEETRLHSTTENSAIEELLKKNNSPDIFKKEYQECTLVDGKCVFSPNGFSPSFLEE